MRKKEVREAPDLGNGLRKPEESGQKREKTTSKWGRGYNSWMVGNATAGDLEALQMEGREGPARASRCRCSLIFR